MRTTDWSAHIRFNNAEWKSLRVPDNFLNDIVLKEGDTDMPRAIKHDNLGRVTEVLVDGAMRGFPHTYMRQFYEKVGFNAIDVNLLPEQNDTLTMANAAIEYLVDEIRAAVPIFELVRNGLFYLNNVRPFRYAAIAMRYLPFETQQELHRLVTEALEPNNDWRHLLNDFPEPHPPYVAPVPPPQELNIADLVADHAGVLQAPPGCGSSPPDQ